MITGRSFCLLLALSAVACVQPYEPPRVDQPHAVIKVRRSYETQAGSNLHEAVDIDENYVLRETSLAGVASAPLTDSFLAHPVVGNFVLRSNFYHLETHMVSESYQVPHTSYSMESYSCGSGSTYRSCTRSVSRTTYETRHRTVPRTVEVSDGACGRQFRFAPQADHVYLLQYTYQAPGVCRLACFEQVQGPDGSFQNRYCKAAPPPEN